MVKKLIIITSIGLLLVLCGMSFYGYVVFRESQRKAVAVAANIETINDSTFLKPQVLGVSTNGSTGNDASLSSENYQIKQIAFGGEIAMANGNNNDDLEVQNVHSEMLMTKNQQDYKFLITWQTNKLATSEVEYGKTGGATKTLVENGFGFVHSIVLSQLDPAAAYTYVIRTQDQWGNTITSDRYAMYTSQRALSVFELISKEFTGIFGWAVKKN